MEPLLAGDRSAIVAAFDEALAGYDLPYLALFGIDPGPDHPAWLAERIPGAVVEVWDGSGHYPHLVDPDAFVARLRAFWTRH